MAGDIEHARLRELFAGFSVSRSEIHEDFEIAASLGVSFAARARCGSPALLIPVPSAPIDVARKGGGFVLSASSQVVFKFGGKRWTQASAILQSTSSDLAEIFSVLAADIARKSSRIGEAVEWGQIVEWVDEWQLLLAKQRLLSEEQQLGLWGELWFLRQAVDADLICSAWRGPDGDAVDVFLNGVGVEIKTSRRQHVHHISRRQAELPVGRNESYVLSLWACIDPNRGVTLTDLVTSILHAVVNRRSFLERLADVGYSISDSEQYTTKFALLDDPLWFSPAQVPRIRHIDLGVSQVRYVITLDVDAAAASAETSRLWHHFCGRNVPLALAFAGEA